MAGFKSEWWPVIDRNAGRLHVGIRSPEHLQREMRLNLLMGHLLLHTVGVTAEARQSWSRALAIAEQRDVPSDLASAAAANWMGAYAQGDYARMDKMADLYSVASGASGSPAAISVSDRMHVAAYHFLGRQVESAALAERVLAAPNGPVDYGYNSGHTFDPRIALLTILARVSWVSGDWNRAQAIADEGVALATNDGGALTIAYVLAFAAGPVAFWSRNWDLLEEQMLFLQDHAKRYSLRYWQSWGDILLRVARWNLNARSPSQKPKIPDQLEPIFPSQLAETLACGDADLVTPAAMDRALSGQAPWCQAELMRIRTLRLYSEGQMGEDGVIASLGDAIEIAKSQGARTFELRAQVSRLEFIRSPGHPADTKGVNRLLDWFQARGNISADVERARVLLASSPARD